MSGRGWLCGFDRMGRRVRADDNAAKPTINSLDINESGAYTAPISPETTEHATGRVGTQWDENPMDTRVSAIAGERVGSLGMGFRGLAVKGSGVRIPSAPPERQTLKPLLRQGFQRVRGCLQAESGRVFPVASPRGVRESPQEYGVETLGGSLVDALEQVPVRVQGDLNRRVSQTELDHFRVFALGDEYGCMRVPEIMESERLTD